MKYIQLTAIIGSILTITNFCYSDWATDIDRYYANPYHVESYIDTNKDISMESYIKTNIDYAKSSKEGIGLHFPPSTHNEQKTIYFQPCDGSMTNGTYDNTNKTAKTALYSYDNVIVFNGTHSTPKLTSTGKYKNAQNLELESIGSLKIPAPDESPSDSSTYFLFGTKVQTSQPTKTKENSPTQDYNSQGE